jgi:hypothetical protein
MIRYKLEGLGSSIATSTMGTHKVEDYSKYRLQPALEGDEKDLFVCPRLRARAPQRPNSKDPFRRKISTIDPARMLAQGAVVHENRRSCDKTIRIDWDSFRK